MCIKVKKTLALNSHLPPAGTLAVAPFSEFTHSLKREQINAIEVYLSHQSGNVKTKSSLLAALTGGKMRGDPEVTLHRHLNTQ